VDERRALKLMESYARRKVGYVDCVSFVVMEARAMRVAFTFDRAHFVKLRKLETFIPIPRRPARR
jgi:predicted nucleic acid-binding protein